MPYKAQQQTFEQGHFWTIWRKNQGIFKNWVTSYDFKPLQQGLAELYCCAG